MLSDWSEVILGPLSEWDPSWDCTGKGFYCAYIELRRGDVVGLVGDDTGATVRVRSQLGLYRLRVLLNLH